MAHDISPMRVAIKQAIKAAKNGEVPVGAVLIDSKSGDIVAKACNQTRVSHDPTAHAEVNVIRIRCAELGTERLPDHDLYVTLEPCAMCATAISHARIRRVYFGAYDPKGGGIEQGPAIFTHPQIMHKPNIIGGVLEKECAAILKDFFSDRR
jgi:tRNA(Arg) A34 adenosine deaminase TadA